jgi:hypothetical protein
VIGVVDYLTRGIMFERGLVGGRRLDATNRDISVVAGALALYYLSITVLCIYAAEWVGIRMLPIYMVAIACSIPAVVALKYRFFDPLEPVWLYSIIFFLEFVLKPLLTLGDPHRFGFTMLPLDYDNMRVSRSLMIAGGGLLAFYCGYYFSLRAKGVPIYRLSDKWKPGREIFMTLFGLAAFMYAVNFFFSRVGYSFSAIYLNRAATGGLSGELSFLIHIFGWIAVLIPFRRCLVKRDLLAWIGFAGLLTIVMTGFSIFGARWTLFFVPVSLVVISHYVVSRLSAIKIGLIFSLVFAGSAAFGAFRGSFDFGRLALSSTVTNIADEIAGFADWDIFLAIQEFYPEYRPYYNGRLASEAVLWLVPRSVWPTKPIQYGSGRIQDDIAPNLRILGAEGGYTGTSISQSTIGEGYADFGVPGALLYMALFGVVWGWVYRIARDNSFSFPLAATYSLMYILLPLCVRGFSSSIIIMALWGLLATSAFVFLAGGWRRA